MSHLRNLGDQFKIPIPCDEKGYVGRKCPTENCKRYFKFKEGTLYPALHRMETGKLIISSWQSSNGRQRKYYSITEKGLKLLTVEKTQWMDFLNAMRLIIEPLRN